MTQHVDLAQAVGTTFELVKVFVMLHGFWRGITLARVV
jgi:hypothetical protein